jgi:hypothetical protein
MALVLLQEWLVICYKDLREGWSVRGSPPRMWTCNGSWPNGVKLAPARVLEQLLPQCLPGCDHQREGLGTPLLDARLHLMGAYGVHDQCY